MENRAWDKQLRVQLCICTAQNKCSRESKRTTQMVQSIFDLKNLPALEVLYNKIYNPCFWQWKDSSIVMVVGEWVVSWQVPARSHCGIEWLTFWICSSAQVCKELLLKRCKALLHKVFNHSRAEHPCRENEKVLANVRSKRDLSKALIFCARWLIHWTCSHPPAEGIKA